MIRRFRLVLMLSAVLSTAACHPHQTAATPRAASAIKADDVVIRVNELQATVIEICGPGATCTPGGIDTALARMIVQTCLDVRQVVRAAPDGWRASAKQAWTQARPKFATVSNPAILAALSAVDVVIGGL